MASPKFKSSKHRSKVEEGVTDYYKRVCQMLNDNSVFEDEKAVLLSNVFEELTGNALQVCCCPKTSLCVEDLIEAASLSHVIKVLKVLIAEWQILCEDGVACHVLEKLISLLPRHMSKAIEDSGTITTVDNCKIEEEEDSDDVRIIKLFLEISDLVLENLDTNLTHVYASHVLRMLLQVIGGSSVGENVLKSRTSRRRDKEVSGEKKKHVQFTDYPVPSLFLKRLTKFAEKIFKQENIGALLTEPNASPVIQTLLLVLHKNDLDLCQKYIHKVIKSSRIKDVEKNENPELIKLPPVVLDTVGSFLVELVLTLTTPDTFTELYEELFKGRLLQFAVHPKANFVLQSLIGSCREKDMFQNIFDEACQHLEDILAASHFGVVVSLAGRCQKLRTRQRKCTELLMRAFHCFEPEERQNKFASLLLAVKTYEFYCQLGENGQDKSKEEEQADIPLLSKCNYHGALLLQNLVQFTNPKTVVRSLLDLKPLELRNVSCDPCGSHVIDAFFKAEGVGDKNKDALLKKLQGFYVEIACHRNGSRTLEALWQYLNMKLKTFLATELCEQEAKISRDQFGRHIYRNFALCHFMKRRNDWIGVQKDKNKKRELFKDILGISEQGVSTAKKPRHASQPNNDPGRKKRKKKREMKKKQSI